jgi:photosystem II stability/assembly factor-like uncharacterized protein
VRDHLPGDGRRDRVAGSGAVNAGILGGGVFRIQPAFTDEWSPWSQGLSSTDIRALAVGNNVVLAGSAGGGVFKSSDGGVNWAASNVNLTTLDVRALVYDTDHPGTFYAGTNGGGVFKSTDSGASWTAVNSGLASTSVLSMTVAAGVVYAGAADGTIYQSTSGGASWALAFTEPGGHAIQALALGAQSPSKVYAATRGAGVYVSIDSGANWTPRNNGLVDPEQSQPIRDIRAAAVAPDGRVYVGVIGNHYNVDHHNNGGVFASADDGATWTSVGAGLSYGGGYLSVGFLAPNTFVGCYAEGDQNNWIVPPSIVVGGILATEMTPPPPGFSTQVISSRGIFGIPHVGSVVQSVRQITAEQAMFVQNTSATDRFVLVDAPGNRPAVLVLNPPGTVGGQLLTIQKTNASDYPVHVQGALEGGLGALDLLLPFATVTLLAADPEWKIVEWKNFNRASVNEFADPTTVAYPVFGYIPAYAGNYLVGVYYRVVGGATDVKLVLQWGDVVGTQQQTLVNVTGQPVGSYGVAPAIVNCVVGGEIIMYATASVADQLIVSTTAERLA